MSGSPSHANLRARLHEIIFESDTLAGKTFDVALLLAIVGSVLAASGLRQRATPWIVLDPWVRLPRALIRVAVVLVCLIAYTVVVDALGFLITGVLLLSVLFAAFGVRRVHILPVAVGVTVAMHYAFYSVLHVPLPWGVLEAIAW